MLLTEKNVESDNYIFLNFKEMIIRLFKSQFKKFTLLLVANRVKSAFRIDIKIFNFEAMTLTFETYHLRQTIRIYR